MDDGRTRWCDADHELLYGVVLLFPQFLHPLPLRLRLFLQPTCAGRLGLRPPVPRRHVPVQVRTSPRRFRSGRGVHQGHPTATRLHFPATKRSTNYTYVLVKFAADSAKLAISAWYQSFYRLVLSPSLLNIGIGFDPVFFPLFFQYFQASDTSSTH